jgi:hypothetical protein
MQQDLFYPLESRKTPEKVKYIQNFELPTIDYKTQKHVSFSQMNVFRGCEYRWKLEYKDGLRKFTSSSHTTFGTAMHETLQSYLDVLYNESEQKADDLDLNTIFKNNFMKEYEKQVKENDGDHYMTKDEFIEFYEDGVDIINNFKSDRQKHFYKDKIHLVGCEIPITLPPDPDNPNVVYIGYLDVVIYNEKTGRFKIIDIKTSTKGWFKWAKEDETKQFQLLLYKKYFSIQYDVPEDKIDIEFFILKRKLWENSKYPQNHIQLFEPVSGPIKTNKAVKAMSSFINECFDKDGSYLERDFTKNPSKKSCMFCPYKEDRKLCGLGVNF